MDLYIRDADNMFKRGEILQRGAGAFTLCEPCNNNTGTWYAAEYVTWAKMGFELLSKFPRTGQHWAMAKRVRPLRFLKQVITMFFSVNAPDFGDHHPELREFVLNRHLTGLPPEYDVYMGLVRAGYGRSSGISGMASLEKNTTRLVSEIVHIPFALLLAIDSQPLDSLGRITRFAHRGFDEVADVNLILSAGEAHTPFPADYRTKEAVEKARVEGEAMMRLPPEERGYSSPETTERMRSQLHELQEKWR